MGIDDEDSFGKKGITFLFVGVPADLVRSADKEYYLPSVFAWKECIFEL